MALKKIRLELARTPDHPEGSAACGYEFTAPLDSKGLLDGKAWPQDRTQCTVRRFWEGTEDEHGHLVHHRGENWVFSYPAANENEEPIFHFDRHVFRAGEYISVTEHDGIERPFRVASVRSVV